LALLQYVGPDTWRIERINKDMQLILYSPEYLGQHTILVHTQHTLGSLGLPYFCCSHTTLFVSFDESIYDLVACSLSKNGTGVHNKMSPSKDSLSDALNDWNAETYYYDSIRLYGRECLLQDNPFSTEKMS